MGAEIGNSTQKLHARGPIGLRELCTFKYLVEGDGQVRRVSCRRLASASSAGRSTRRTSATSSARRRRYAQLGLDRVLLMPVHDAAAQGGRGRPGRRAPRSRCAGSPSRATSGFAVSRARGRTRPGPSYTVDTLQGLHERTSGRRADVHRRRRHGPQPADLARAGARSSRWPRSPSPSARASGATRHRRAPGAAARRRPSVALLRHAADRRLLVACPRARRRRAARSATSCPTPSRDYIAAQGCTGRR